MAKKLGIFWVQFTNKNHKVEVCYHDLASLTLVWHVLYLCNQHPNNLKLAKQKKKSSNSWCEEQMIQHSSYTELCEEWPKKCSISKSCNTVFQNDVHLNNIACFYQGHTHHLPFLLPAQ